MKRMIRILALTISILLWANWAHAEAQAWEIDKAHSSIYFDVRHTFATVRGQFEDFSGTFLFDPNDKDGSRIDMEVAVKSINTNITKRDNHLRSDDFFAAKTHPLMTFKSKRVKAVEGNRYIIEGDLTIKGMTKAVAVPFTYFGMRENPLKKGQMVAGFEADFTIDRLDYQVGSGKFYEMGVIGREVRIVITLEILKDK